MATNFSECFKVLLFCTTIVCPSISFGDHLFIQRKIRVANVEPTKKPTILPNATLKFCSNNEFIFSLNSFIQFVLQPIRRIDAKCLLLQIPSPLLWSVYSSNPYPFCLRQIETKIYYHIDSVPI